MIALYQRFTQMGEIIIDINQALKYDFSLKLYIQDDLDNIIKGTGFLQEAFKL